MIQDLDSDLECASVIQKDYNSEHETVNVVLAARSDTLEAYVSHTLSHTQALFLCVFHGTITES